MNGIGFKPSFVNFGNTVNKNDTSPTKSSSLSNHDKATTSVDSFSDRLSLSSKKDVDSNKQSPPSYPTYTEEKKKEFLEKSYLLIHGVKSRL
jgi:hypothetical protein